MHIDTIRKHAAAAEAAGQLHAEQLKIINEEGWFQLFVPRAYGGLELSLPQAVRLEEEIAFADGSVGWVVTLCAGAAMFIGYFEKDLIAEVFSEKNVCIAGSGKTSGNAVPENDGFRITGSWPYASGAPHAQWFTANCVIDDQTCGKLVKSFIFKKEEVVLSPEWKYIGLNATAGYSFSVNNLFVPANRTFIIDPLHAKLPGPVYTYPFLQLAETTIAVNIYGMAGYFLKLANGMIENKLTDRERSASARNKGLILVSTATAALSSIKTSFYKLLDASWHEHTLTNNISPQLLNSISEKSRALAQQSRKLVNDIFPYCGLEAAKFESDINRVWRNINTAGQHSLML